MALLSKSPFIITNMTAKADSQSALAHLAFCQQHESEMLALLRKMVEIESPSDDKAAVDRMGAFLAEVFERLGGRILYPQEAAGNHLKAEFAGSVLAALLAEQTPSPCFCWDTLTPSGRWALWRRCPFR